MNAVDKRREVLFWLHHMRRSNRARWRWFLRPSTWFTPEGAKARQYHRLMQFYNQDRASACAEYKTQTKRE